MSKVYILGAGASRALKDDAPLMSGLLEHILNFCLTTKEKDHLGTRAQEVTEFITKFYNSDGKHYLPLFEDVISQFDYCILNNRPLSTQYGVDELARLKKSLIYIMGRAIADTSLDYRANPLVNNFFNFIKHDTCIISLNYDLMIDEGFQTRYGVINYGLRTRNLLRKVNDGYWPLPDETLYKLHGSLNWLYCPTCKDIETTYIYPNALEMAFDGDICSVCQTPREVLLITPSFLKDYSNAIVHEFWMHIEAQLEKADEVVFIGYSLPDADIMLRLFFSRSIYTNRASRGRTCKIRVIDMEEPGTAGGVQERYLRLFGEIDYDQTGFLEYILRGCQTKLEQEQSGLSNQ